MDTLILALVLTTGQDHLPSLYLPCCCYGQEGREERAPLQRPGLWRQAHASSAFFPQNQWPQDPCRGQSSQGLGTWRFYRGSCRSS